MTKNQDIRHGRHCVFILHIHLVFVTKYRRDVFTKAILDDLKETFASVCADFGADLVEFDGEDDHIHLSPPHGRFGRRYPMTGDKRCASSWSSLMPFSRKI